jgi:hypothetical protein
LKDRDAPEDPDFIAMNAWLAERDNVGFVDRRCPDMLEISRRARGARLSAKRAEVQDVAHD